MLIDNHGREVNYLRLAVTDRCNLRCFYCMPAEGIEYMPKSALMSYEEMLKLVRLFSEMGINKVRITGGEPFVRKDLWSFLENLSSIEAIHDITITTNGLLTLPYISKFKSIGITSVNLSLDSLDAERFKKITRRDELDKVLASLESLLEHGINTKINCVLMAGMNEMDIIPFIELTKNKNVNVRFIEEMPFNGSPQHSPSIEWNYKKILSHIESHYTSIEKLKDSKYSTSLNYKAADHLGSFGVIPAFSRTFCGSCNRLRLTAQGNIKTCLYGGDVLNVKDLLRAGESDDLIKQKVKDSISKRAKDGFEAAEKNIHPIDLNKSMSTIGG